MMFSIKRNSTVKSQNVTKIFMEKLNSKKNFDSKTRKGIDHDVCMEGNLILLRKTKFKEEVFISKQRKLCDNDVCRKQEKKYQNSAENIKF